MTNLNLNNNPLDLCEARRMADGWDAHLLTLRNHKIARFILFRNDELLIEAKRTPKIALLDSEQIASLLSVDFEAVFLGVDREKPFFVVDLSNWTADFELPPALKFVALQTAFHQLSGHAVQLLSTAKQLLYWQRRTRFCGACGALMADTDGGLSRLCSNCGEHYFRQVDAVVIVLIYKGNRCLLGQSIARKGTNHYSCLAGHINQAESVENAVHREIFEESGVEVGNLQYRYSQQWPFPHKLMLGFWAEALSETITVDTNELVDVKWFELHEVAKALKGDSKILKLSPPTTIANQLISDWVQKQTH